MTSRAPSDQEVIRDLVLDPNPDLEEEEVSRLFRESLDIQGHGARYYHHSDREAFLATQAHGQQHNLRLKQLINLFCKRNCSDYFMLRFEARVRARGCLDVIRQLPRARLRRGEEGAQSEGRTPATVCRALAALQRVLPSLPHIATLTTRAPRTMPSLSRPADASPGLSSVQALLAPEERLRFNNKTVKHLS